MYFNLDRELVEHFIKGFEQHCGRYLGGQRVKKVRGNEVAHVVTKLGDGTTINTEKMLVLSDEYPHIYAVGDMVGAPALASKAMEHGRRAVRHALNLPIGDAASTIPLGIYTIPEMARIGLDE